MKAFSEEIYGKSMLKSKFSGLHDAADIYGSIFIRLAVVSQICKIPRNSPKTQIHSSSMSLNR